MKLTISKIRWRPVQVEIPEACPECSADFTEEDLRVFTMSDNAKRASLRDGDLYLGANDYEGDAAENEEPWALECGNCGKLLASAQAMRAPSTGATVPVRLLSQDERALLCAALNVHGSGEHPVADPDSLGLFAADYALACMDRALALDGQPCPLELRRHLTADGQHRALLIRRLLEATVHGEVSSWR